MLFDEISQSPPVTKLVDKVVVVGGSEHFNEFNDIWMIDFC